MELKDFIGLYPVSKTLRFELKPQGRTLEWIEKNGLLDQDEHRAGSYKVIKKIIDHYHKHFIECSLQGLQQKVKADLANGGSSEFVRALSDMVPLMGKADTTLRKKYEKCQEYLRKEIVKSFDTSRLFGKELIKEDLMAYLYECQQDGVELPEHLTIEECKSIVTEFDQFTTYFVGFHDNRRNMYSADVKATAISFRLIHENYPKFVANKNAWAKIKEALAEALPQLEQQMVMELRGKPLAYYFEETCAFVDCMAQSDIDCYNTLIGGRSEGAVKVQGINELINLYNQQHKEKLPKMTELYKMILSDRGTLSWLPESFTNDQQLLEAVEKAYQELHHNLFEDEGDDVSLKELLANIADYNLDGIYIKNDTALTSVLKQACGDWAVLTRAMEAAYDQEHPCKDASKLEKHEEKRKKYIDSYDSFSLQFIADTLGTDKVTNYFSQLGSLEDQPTLFDVVDNGYAAAKDLLNSPYHGKLTSDKAAKDIETLKTLLDSLKELQRFVKALSGNGDEGGRDGRFYAEYERLVQLLDQVTPLYNMVRNYVTQKPYSEEKFKLNFGSPQLLNGWDANKERDYLGVLMRKEGCYYLAIMDKKSTKCFEGDLPAEGACYEKVDYKLLPGANKTLPRVFFSKKNIDYYAPSDTLMQHYEQETHKKGDNFSLRDCHELIDFFKQSIERHPDWRQFGFQFSDTSTYEDLSGFYREVEHQGYKLSFRPVSSAYIDKLVEDGKLYLFQIYSKDFSTFSKGTPNMHTLYWKALFSEENLRDVVYKLNGKAEVFFRRKSINYDEEKLQKGHHYEELKDKFDYPIIKDRRYAFDKFQFHVPITMNFKSEGRYYIDQQVREYIKQGGVEHIIGIDRGERHLLYLSLIDLQGRIVKQFTLNEIVNEYKGETYRTDYHALLDKREGDRDAARKNWQTIETIKELKEGYLSQVVHVISQMMVKYRAIVVLEDLNFGFMRGRQKVEKQVYQKFEKMLIDKLNYLVDKKAPADAVGGLMHALQLTSKFESFQKLGKQSGFLFYIPASLTSKIDPATGFANYISAKYESVEKSRTLLGSFADIRFNAEKDYFEFVIDDYSKFNPKAVGRQQWTLCSYGTHIRTFRNPEKNNEFDSQEVVLTDVFKALFDRYGIDYRANLMGQVLLQDKAEFFRDMLHLLSLLLQLRNSRTGTDEDYILSPVADADGLFYDSRDYAANDAVMPKDADANGAYNIARKGLWMLQQIQQADDVKEARLAIKNEEWMRFAQEKPYRK